MVRTPDLCNETIDGHFQVISKVEKAMEKFLIEHRGSQMTERASSKAEKGMLSMPVAHSHLRLVRLSCTKSWVVIERLKIGGVKGRGGGREAKLGAKLEELTDAK